MGLAWSYVICIRKLAGKMFLSTTAVRLKHQSKNVFVSPGPSEGYCSRSFQF